VIPTFEYLAASLSLVVGVLALISQRRSLATLVFFASAALLAVESLFAGQAASVIFPAEIGRWESLRLAATAGLPGLWFTLSLVYARGNPRDFLRRNTWLITLAFLGPLILRFGFAGELLARAELNPTTFDWVLGLGWAGLGIQVWIILFAVLSLANLERTFWTSIGTARWKIKYTILGLSVLLVTRIYTSAQALIYSSMNLGLEGINAGALTLACLLMGVSFIRPKSFHVDVYPSQAVLGKSLSALLAGAYLLVVGGAAKAIVKWGGRDVLPLSAFLVLLAFAGLAVLLFSERVRQHVRRFVSRQFRRPLHDYRKVWLTFTERTATLMDREELCRVVVKAVSELFEALSVTLWLTEESRSQPRFGASTVLTATTAGDLLKRDTQWGPALTMLRRHALPFELDTPGCSPGTSPAFTRDAPGQATVRSSAFTQSGSGAGEESGRPPEGGPQSETDAAPDPAVAAIQSLQPVQFANGGARVCVPLVANDRVLGLLLVGDRVSGAPFGIEDLDLLKCVGDQVSANLLNLALSGKAIEAREMQAFQTMSAFMVHDLKNTASTLSLLLQNLSAHFDEPAFKKDALQAVRRGTEHINELIGRLASLRQRLEIRPRDSDLNEIVKTAVASAGTAPGVTLAQSLAPLPRCALDPDQVFKVLLNLILNAREAVADGGKVQIETARQNGWVVCSVTDNGCGMSPDFIRQSLFKPFQTTKKRGMGIGMVQSKMIVEAHGGRVEVKSELGKGTTISVLLPVSRAAG
jgi:signal transduction histidine kinase